MVSLANGSTDVPSNAITDSVVADNNDVNSHKELDNRIFEQKSTLEPFVGFLAHAPVTEDSWFENERAYIQESLVKTSLAALDKSGNISETVGNGLDNCPSDSSLHPPSVSNESLMNGNEVPAVMETNSSVSSVSVPGVSDHVRTLKNIAKSDARRKVVLVNSSCLLEGTNTSEILAKDDASAAVIGKMKVADVHALTGSAATRSFVQLSKSNMKNITLNVTPASTNSIILQPKQPYEILRAKLMENGPERAEPTLPETPMAPIKAKTMLETILSVPQANVVKSAVESSAIIEAKNELNKCRKKLIEAAIFPQLATKAPLNGYVGPTFSCEECQDTFVSEDSLINHHDRRSVLFTYACPSCNQTLEFYNRCTLILHVRSHQAPIKATCLTISTIPSSKLKFSVIENWLETVTNDDDVILMQTRSSITPSTNVPVTRKPVTNIARKITEPSSVCIVKSFKKKKQPPVSTVVEDGDSNSLNDEMSTLKTLLVGGREISRKRSKEGSSKLSKVLHSTNGKKSSEGTTDEETPPVKSSAEKTVKIRRNSVKAKTTLKQSLPSVAAGQEASSSSEVTVSGVKPKDLTQTPTVSNKSIQEIILSSSEEEEDSIPDSNEKIALVMCRDCKTDVPHLTRHYRGDDRPKKEYPCDECHFLNASPCALSAHIRMHTKTLPLVCPDCGYFFSTLETFLLHVKQVCFYDFKNIRFKCPECSALKPSAPKFAEHLRREHTREVFKCTACMTSAYSPTIVESHIEKTHPNPDESVSVLEGYWCKLCPNMLVSKPLIDQHIKKHVYSLQYLQYVYICKVCNNYASLSRSKFARHYHSVCAQPTEETIIETPAKKPTRIRKRGGKRLPDSHKRTSETNSNEAKELGENSSQGDHCATDSSKKDIGTAEDLCAMCRKTRVNKSSSMFCHQCMRIVDAEDPSSVTETTSEDGVSRFTRKFKCKQCKEYMNRDWSVITKHYELFHHSDFDVRAKIRSTSSDNSQTAAANRKRKMMMKAQDGAKILKTDSKYKCAKCSIATNDRKQFHEHIVMHKAPSDSQCLECGLCFIVRASLEKHLIVEHKIRQGDLKEYFKANGMDVAEEKIEEKPLKENQCEVCHLQCESKQNYDKHIRTHGMAFVAMQSKAKV